MFDRMTMCFHTVNCPFDLAGGVRKNKGCFEKWRSFRTIFSAKPSSLILEGNENSPNSGSSHLDSITQRSTGSSSHVLCQGKKYKLLPSSELHHTVGIIGGVSALSTNSFLDKLVKYSLAEGEEIPPFIVCSDPVLNRIISSNERNVAPYTRFKNIHNQFDVALVLENLRRKRVFLENSGARCIVMPCHISNAWHKEISHGCSVPLFHMGECVAKELKQAKLRPVETGSNVRIGVISPVPALTTCFYQKKLEDQGFEVVVPDEATIEHTVIPAMEALYRKDIEGARNLLRIALQILLVRAVNTIIIASDDMRALLPLDDPLLKKCTDPVDVLARSTLQWAKNSSSP